MKIIKEFNEFVLESIPKNKWVKTDPINVFRLMKKVKNNTINESIKNKLKGKSDKDIKNLINQSNQKEKGKLLIKASEKGYLNIVKILINLGIDVDTKDNFDTTSLMIASQHGHLDIVKFLVNNRADINTKNHFGETALIWAEFNRHKDIINYLKRKILK